jgi:plasmid stabilization system protein ParE
MSRRKLLIHSEAQLEIEEAFERYRQESPRTADRFLKEIGASLKKIRSSPRLYPPYTKNTRRRVLGSFPFSVIYQDRENMILIVAIAHAKRREGYWAKRLKQ